jgi:hypothetical protein
MLCTFFCFDIQNNICTQHVANLYFSGNSMNNLSSYYGLTDSRVGASEKKLPVQKFFILEQNFRAEVGILASGVNS